MTLAASAVHKTLRMLAVHTVPVWDRDGASVYGLEHYSEYGFAEQPDVIGWANIAVLELRGKVRELLLVSDEHA